MLKIVVCDDERSVFEQMEKYVMHYSMAKNIEYKISHYATAKDLLNAGHDYNILFLDIMLDNGSDGIAVGKQLRIDGNTALFVLVTSRADRAIDGYEANVFRYLVKPISREQFYSAMDSLIEELEYNQKRVAIKFKYETSYIHAKDIIYVESYSRKRHVVTRTGRYETTADWEEILEQLSGYPYFFAPKRSYLINLMHVTNQSPAKVVMSNGERIAFDNGKHEQFLVAFSNLLDGRTQINS